MTSELGLVCYGETHVGICGRAQLCDPFPVQFDRSAAKKLEHNWDARVEPDRLTAISLMLAYGPRHEKALVTAKLLDYHHLQVRKHSIVKVEKFVVVRNRSHGHALHICKKATRTANAGTGSPDRPRNLRNTQRPCGPCVSPVNVTQRS
jgi:hypothetical protein